MVATMGDTTDKIAELAKALSVLDNDVERQKKLEGGGDEKAKAERLLARTEKFEQAGRRWNRELLKAWLENDVPESLAVILTSGTPPQALIAPEEPPGLRRPLRNLHEFLSNAVERAIEIGGANTEKCGAGAIFLHNPLHDELIMSAAWGFPFSCSDRDKFVPKVQTAVDDLISLDSANESGYVKDEFMHNIARLDYLRKDLRKNVAPTTIARHSWVRYALRGNYPAAELFQGVNCNEDLVGIAYYKPREGITGQLFDRDEGPRMERTRLNRENVEGAETTFAQAFEAELQSRLGPKPSGPLFRHLRNELLQRRTVVYDERQDMGAGRQVRAGRYEPLQFPAPCFIGPFLGTVLRFNGEHLGVLKIEKHKFIQSPEEKPAILGFRGSHAADFLLFSYVLSGYLYILKHHAGIDLSDGWTKSVRES